jgi:penicillin-binding protein 2
MPGYDLNSFRREYPDHLADEVNLPLMHRAIAAQYPPGSTVKPVSAVAGLASGQVGPHTTFNCAGIMHGSDRPNRCWIARYGVGHGAVDVVEAIQHSCNIYFYGVANRIGLEELGGWFKRFGLGSVPGTGLAGERAGNVPLDSPYRGEARNCSIGQGKMLATPMQVANMMATIARGGRFLSPIVSLEGGPPREARDLPATAEQIRLVHEGMHRVVDDRQGTAWKIFHQGAEPLGFGVCGKTGTAQASPQRVDGQIVREGDHAWFAGFAPYGRPTVAFAIIVEYAGGGGANAGPLARETLRACKQMGYIR